MEQIMNEYYADNAQKLHGIVDKILVKFGGLQGKDKDDFYSLANEVFVDAMRRYDGVQTFDGFLYSCLCNKMKTEITKRNRYKRKAERLAVSIDTPIGDSEDSTLADVIADDFDMEKEVWGEKEEGYSKEMTLYLKRLSRMQKEILKFIISGYSPHEIQKELHISDTQYADAMNSIRAYRNISILL